MPEMFHQNYDWSNPKQALAEMKENILSRMKIEENWYVKHRKNHGRITRVLRVVSILLFAFGIIWPIVRQNFPSIEQKNYEVGYISLAIGSLLLLLDKYLGISTGFVRFYIAELDIKKNTLEFEENWQIETVKASNPLTTENILALINTLKTFRQAVYTTIQVESGAWASEFQNQTGELYELFKQKQSDYKLGSISVVIKNHVGYTDIRVGLDDSPPQALNGKTSIIFNNISIKPHLVFIEAIKGGEVVRYSENVLVLGEKAAELVITLP